ncbi:SDR family NAD(P)-dependent oxidoreductase, partial [Corallococcus praedator]
MFPLQNKTALITGGASGIGLAIAQTFAQAGAHVHILDLNGGQAEQVASDIRRAGGNATGHAVDVSNQPQT